MCRLGECNLNREKELVKNTAIISFGKICTQLVSFLLLPLYTAILSTSEYGTVDLVMTYSTLLLPFITLALEQALFRFLIDIRNDDKKCAEYISVTTITSFIGVSVCLIIIAVIYFVTNNVLFIYFGLVLISSVISAVCLQICRGLGDNIGYTLGSTISAIVHVVLNVVFLVSLRMGATGMMLATFFGNLSCGLFTYSRCSLNKYLKFKYFRRKALKELCAYSLPLIPNQLSWWALNASDKIIVQVFIGVAGNGLIAVANKFSTVYIQFSNIFNISWTESVALHINDEDAQLFLSKTIDSVYRLFLCACCGIIVCIPFVFPIMINSKYYDAYGLIPIFMVASLFNVIVSLYGVIYVAHKKTIEIAKTAVYAALLNIISHMLLIKFIGIYAAAVSTTIGYGGMAVYRYFHSRRYIVVKFSNISLLCSGVLITLSFVSYYSTFKAVQIIVFVIVAIVSIFLNKCMIISFINIIKGKVR